AVDIGRHELLWQHRSGSCAVQVFPAATILTILLPDTADLGRPPAAASDDTAVAEATAADEIARVLEDVSESHEIPYLKVLGNCVVAAAGFSGEPALAARAIARAALALREKEDLSASGLRMGIDTGVVQGGPVGRGLHCYNLCGAAARRAAEMAQSAPMG